MNTKFLTLLTLLLVASTQMTHAMDNPSAQYHRLIHCIRQEFKDRGFPDLPNQQSIPHVFESLSPDEHALLDSREMQLLKSYCAHSRSNNGVQSCIVALMRIDEHSRDRLKMAYMLYTKLDYQFKKAINQQQQYTSEIEEHITTNANVTAETMSYMIYAKIDYNDQSQDTSEQHECNQLKITWQIIESLPENK